MMHGYNFTERFRSVLAKAREESARLHHEYVGTEHMLLGLVREGDGVAIVALGNLKVNIAGVGDRIESIVHRGRSQPARGHELPYTSRANRVLELAMEQAFSLGHAYVGSEHLLLGLIVEGKGIAAQVLAEAGVQFAAARTEILNILGSNPTPEALAVHVSDTSFESTPKAGVAVVDVVVQYGDGRRIARSFASVNDAQRFLASVGQRRPD